MTTRILLADDHKMFRDGLRSLLERQSSFEIVGEAEDGRAAVRMATKLSPQVIVMDINMPDLNGVEATRQILAEDSSIKVVALSLQSDGSVVRRMLQAGARGYLVKEAAFDELVKAIGVVLTGRTYLGEAVTHVVVQQLVSPIAESLSPLTAKEREVLQLLAEGKGTKEIAAALFVSTKTIDTHRQHIMSKLDLHNLADLTKYAIREGITTAGN